MNRDLLHLALFLLNFKIKTKLLNFICEEDFFITPNVILPGL